jgi:hypothetical protein
MRDEELFEEFDVYKLDEQGNAYPVKTGVTIEGLLSNLIADLKHEYSKKPRFEQKMAIISLEKAYKRLFLIKQV